MILDPTQIHQILMNLCTHAAQAMDDEGSVLKIDLTDEWLGADFTKSYEDLKPNTWYITLHLTSYLYFAERNPDTSLSTMLISLAGSPVRRDGSILSFSS